MLLAKSRRSKSGSSGRECADVNRVHVEATTVFRHVCCFRQVVSWDQNHLNRSVVILTSSCLTAGFFASRYLSDNLTHSISHVKKPDVSLTYEVCPKSIRPAFRLFFSIVRVLCTMNLLQEVRRSTKNITLKFWKDCVMPWEGNDRVSGQAVTGFFTTITRQRIHRTL